MAADPGLHRSGFSEPRKTGAADRSPEASLVKLGRTEEPAAAVLGEDSPGNSAVRWRKLGRRSHNDVGGEARKEDSRKVEPVRVGDESSWRLGWSTARRRRAGIVERIDSSS